MEMVKFVALSNSLKSLLSNLENRYSMFVHVKYSAVISLVKHSMKASIIVD